MDKLGEVEEQLNKVQKKIDGTTWATLVINKLIKVIIALIVFIFLNNIAWIWYISLPVEETQIIQDADTEGENSPITQEIGE